MNVLDDVDTSHWIFRVGVFLWVCIVCIGIIYHLGKSYIDQGIVSEIAQLQANAEANHRAALERERAAEVNRRAEFERSIQLAINEGRCAQMRDGRWECCNSVDQTITYNPATDSIACSISLRNPLSVEAHLPPSERIQVIDPRTGAIHICRRVVTCASPEQSKPSELLTLPFVPIWRNINADYYAIKNSSVFELPSMSSPIIGELESASLVRVTGLVAGGSWYRVMMLDKRIGYVDVTHLARQKPISPLAHEPNLEATHDSVRLIHRVEPKYPLRALEAGKTGLVALDVDIGVDGKVLGVSVVFSRPSGWGFEDAAKHAVLKWRYNALPGRSSNSLVRERHTRVQVKFELPPR